MKTNAVQIIILGVFIFFLVVGVIIFATSGSNSNSTSNVPVEIWGTIPNDTVEGVINTLNIAKSGSIDMSYREYPQESFEQSLIEALADGTGPDAVLIPNEMIVKNEKKFLPIGYDVYSERDFKDSFVEGAEILLGNEGIYGVPLLADPLVMYWNRDILTSKNIARPPTSWEEVLALTETLTEKREDKSIIKSAISFGDYSNVRNAKDIIVALIGQSGGKLIERNAQGVLINQLLNDFGYEVNPFRNAVTFFTDFADPLKPIYSWNRSLPDSLQMFLNGDVAFYFDRASSYAEIKSKNPNLNFDVAVIPQPKGVSLKKTSGKIYSFSLLASSKNVAKAYQTIQLLTSPEVASIFSKQLNLPPARRDLLSLQPGTASGAIFWQSALFIRPWLDPNPKQTELIFKNGIDAVVTGKSNLEDSVKTMIEQIGELINRN